jgi:hypothetical protein
MNTCENCDGECSICSGPIEAVGEWKGGNNAAPFPGRVCNDCDNRFVIPARILNVVSDSELIPILRQFAKIGRNLTRAAAKSRALHAVQP